MGQLLLFYGLSFLLVMAALTVITVRNPVHAVLALIFAFFNAAGLCILLEAELLAMLLIIVYVGAVAVLFLFVVMMLNIKQASRKGIVHYTGLCLALALCMVMEWFWMAPYVPPASPGKKIFMGELLYTVYSYPFQLAGLILLVAMIGAIVLTFRPARPHRVQSVTAQLRRTRREAVALVEAPIGKGIDKVYFTESND
jgi:NADH-quinone oxidoreductase subunit J